MLKENSCLILVCISLIVFNIIFSQNIHAQYWIALPPYNVLWPLWSPSLSPTDPITGVATPLLSLVYKESILSVQPCLVWNIKNTQPLLLYNRPTQSGGGIVYYDPINDIKPFLRII